MSKCQLTYGSGYDIVVLYHLFIVDGIAAFTNLFPRLFPPLKQSIGVILDFPIIWLLFRMVLMVFVYRRHVFILCFNRHVL